MSDLLKNEIYADDVRAAAALSLPWDKFSGKTVMISGATGMIGTFLVDVLQWKNRREGLDCRILALGRNQAKAQERFSAYWGREDFSFVPCDICGHGAIDAPAADYIFHLASNTHPLAYATDPIGTVTANVIGTRNLLDLAAEKKDARVVFASSVEIYGENRGDTDKFREDYCGYIDCNTLRAGYPESKRCGEALCQAYIRQRELDVVIPRLSRTFGPTLLSSDTKAISQFLHKAAAGQDIVLKSAGTQFYSYSYVADAVSGLLYCCLKGACGQAYNIADERCDISLRDLAALAARCAGTRVIFETPDATEKAGYSTATRAVLDSGKLRALGWHAANTMEQAVRKTVTVLRECENL